MVTSGNDSETRFQDIADSGAASFAKIVRRLAAEVPVCSRPSIEIEVYNISLSVSTFRRHLKTYSYSTLGAFEVFYSVSTKNGPLSIMV